MQEVALYRKYRPVDFDQTLGQEHVIRVLKNAVLSNNISHAYLFSGPRGVGKTSVARILAKALNCQKRKKHNPCGECPTCIGIAEGRIIDLVEIDAASNRGIDEIRDLREKVKFLPTDADYKVFIIDEVHMLTKEAFNALLKTLEEPPSHAIFILATTEINKVPATIISRCQRHDFRRVKIADIVSKLSKIRKEEKIKISDEALELIAETSEGGFRDAESLLDQLSGAGLSKIEEVDVENILGLAPHKIISEYARACLLGNSKKALSVLDKAADGGVDLAIMTKALIEFVRKLTVIKIGTEENVEGTKEQITELVKIAEETEIERLLNFSDDLLWAQLAFKTNINPKAVLSLVVARNSIIKKTEPAVTEVTKEELPKKISKKEYKKLKTKKIKENIEITNGKWKQFLLEVKSKNNTIYAFLRVAHPTYKNGEIVLVFPYKFHKERIEEHKNKKIVEDVLEKIYGQGIIIKCELEGNGNNNSKVEDVNKAASILGGEIVED